MATRGSGSPASGPPNPGVPTAPVGPSNPNFAPAVKKEVDTGVDTEGGHRIYKDEQGRSFFESDYIGPVYDLSGADPSIDLDINYANGLLGRFQAETERIKADTSLDDTAREAALKELNSDARDSKLVRWEHVGTGKARGIEIKGFLPGEVVEDWYRSSRIETASANTVPVPAPPKGAPKPGVDEARVREIAAEAARQALEKAHTAAEADKSAAVVAAAAEAARLKAAAASAKPRRKSFDDVLNGYEKVDQHFVVNRGKEVVDSDTGEKSRKPITADQVKALVGFAESKGDKAALDAIARELVAENVVGQNVNGDPASRNEVETRVLGLVTAARERLGMDKYSTARLVEPKGSGLMEEDKEAQRADKRVENAQVYGSLAEEAGFNPGPIGTAEYLAAARNTAELEAWRLHPEAFRLSQLDQIYQQRIIDMAGADPALLEQLNQERIKAVQAQREWFDEQKTADRALLNRTILAAHNGESLTETIDLSKTVGPGYLEDMALIRASALGAGDVILEDKAGGRWHWSKERRGPKVIVTYRSSSIGPNVIIAEQRLRSNGKLLSQTVSTSDQDIRHRKQWFNRWSKTVLLPPKDVVAKVREQHQADKALLYGDDGEKASKFWANTFKREYWSGFGTRRFRGSVYGGLYGRSGWEDRVNRGNLVFRLFGGRG